MLFNISSFLWIVTTIIIILSAIFFLFYYKFTPLKTLNSVKSLSKENIKILNLSLASKIGVGSISGVALSIIIGGKGTLFWIWVSSIFLSIFTYLETKVGICFRKRKKDYNIGGPFVYIDTILNKKYLSLIYLILITFTFLFSFIMIQSNTIIISISNTFLINKNKIIILLIIIVYFSIKKDINRISKIVSILVPLMGFMYIAIGLYLCIKYHNIIPIIINDIINDAFKIKSIFSIPFIVGFQRAVFSNETGMGSTSMVVALSNNNDYKQESFYQVLGMYYITLIICSISALIILTSNYEFIPSSNINGIEIINYCFFLSFWTNWTNYIINYYFFICIFNNYYILLL